MSYGKLSLLTSVSALFTTSSRRSVHHADPKGETGNPELVRPTWSDHSPLFSPAEGARHHSGYRPATDLEKVVDQICYFFLDPHRPSAPKLGTLSTPRNATSTRLVRFEIPYTVSRLLREEDPGGKMRYLVITSGHPLNLKNRPAKGR